jgi:hypothetical protein
MTRTAALYNPGRYSAITLDDGTKIYGNCLLLRAVPYPIGTKLFLTEQGIIQEDPQVWSGTPPEVQLLGTVIKDNYILVTPMRLPVLL